MTWKHNPFNNPNLNQQQADGLAADIVKSRAALDALEKACATAHPNRIKDYINDVTRYMSFATMFCDQASIHCEQVREKKSRMMLNARPKIGVPRYPICR